MPKAKCPIHGTDTTFTTVATVLQEWEVDSNGEFIKVTEDALETVHNPDSGNIWTCTKCGENAEVH